MDRAIIMYFNSYDAPEAEYGRNIVKYDIYKA